jgi:hypothetical protein
LTKVVNGLPSICPSPLETLPDEMSFRQETTDR